MTLLRRLIAFFYLLFRVVQRRYFQAQKQWENTSFKRWSQCFFDRASFRFYYHGAKRDFSRLYEGWRQGHAVSFNGDPAEFDLLEQWWVNVGDLVRDLEIRRRHLRHHWQQENNRAEVLKSELYAAWMALDEKQEEINSLRKSLAKRKGVS